MTATIAALPIVRVPKLWPGETCVVIGGGSSLTAEDVAYCRGKARVIAIKEAGCCRIPGRVAPAPWADVLWASDAKYWRFVQGAPEFQGLKYSIQQDGQERRELQRPIGEWAAAWPDLQVLRDTGQHGLETDPSGLRTGYNSGYAAINLAVHFGASRVILLGFDMWRGPSGDQNWFGPHPSHLESPYAIFLQAFASIAEPLKAAGVEVINCSRVTQLRAFPRADLQDVLR